ncbi:hypothetical protein JWR97_02385 [Pseudomonas cedrina subsp. fulgida]|nr:hypothetical protein [Pseudomonas cedrina subsp. fulgida]
MANTLTLPKKKSSFLKSYVLNTGFIQKADKRKGIPKIKDGTDIDGNYVIIKIWERDKNSDDSDLREIWRNELRQLHRLSGYPGAAEYISELKETFEDELAFYIVISPGQKTFLATHLNKIKNTTPNDQDRIIFWANIKRAALGINILHSQGMLHRKVDEWAILTESHLNQEDFELTGFEWSMRLSSRTSQASESGASYSFIDDWKGLGKIAAKGLNLNLQRISDHRLSHSEVSSSVTTEEIVLIRELLQVKPSPKISQEDIEKSINEIEGRLLSRQNSGNQKLKIAFSIGENGKLSHIIKKLSNNKIESDALEDQLLFLENDLHTPTLIIPDSGNALIVGEQLTYFIKDYESPSDRSKSNWSIAYCEKAEQQRPIIKESTQTTAIGVNSLEFLSLANARREYAKPRARINTWRPLIQRPKQKGLKTGQSSHVQEFWLIQIIDYLFSLIDSHPIQITSVTSTDDDNNVITVSSRSDEQIEAITKLLDIKDTPASRLSDILNSEDRSSAWLIADSLFLGKNRRNDTNWHYVNEVKSDSYSFSGESPISKDGDYYLVSSEQKGNLTQFIRRAKSLKALAEHDELLQMLINPRGKIKNSHDDISDDSSFQSLDPSKQQALKKLISTLPLFLVQGPPGVGKTKLIKELVRRRHFEEPTDRFLLTAQSNSATNHLLDQVKELFQATEKPLIIRCGKNETEDGIPDLKKESADILNKLASSQIFSEASKHIQDKIIALKSQYQFSSSSTRNDAPRHTAATRTFEGLLLRSANFVFATTNSSELERLIEERAQFDWTIIEEAGKATGGELVSPLLLSYRRLMIGDHKQLPPFNSEKTRSILLNSNSLREALTLARPFISSELLDNTANELFNIPENPQEADTDETINFPEVCRRSIGKLFLFEQLIEDELEFQRENLSSKNKIASPLYIQHRMHPAIAEIVSQCFYNGDLKTSPERIEYCANTPTLTNFGSPPTSTQPPIIWIDMPWVQTTMGKKIGEDLPRYINEDEVNAVQIVLENLHNKKDEKESVAILSPYRRQVKKISEHLESQPKLMKHLFDNFSLSGTNSPCFTVDSFQGNEADIVIISLVRNNSAPTIKSSLGFLTDTRRTNVLLSRARNRLIIIGSLDFLDSSLSQARSEDDKEKVKSIQKLLTLIRTNDKKDVAIINYEIIQGWKI